MTLAVLGIQGRARNDFQVQSRKKECGKCVGGGRIPEQ